MASSTLLLAVVGLAVLAYYLGRQRAVSGVLGAGPRVYSHSLPGYHGGYVALWCVLPALLLLALWQIFEPIWLRDTVLAQLPDDLRALPSQQLGLIYNDIRNLVEGNVVSSSPSADILAAASRYAALRQTSHGLATGAVLVLGIACLAWAFRRVRPDFRARNRVERAIEYLLIAASMVAILTTIGIFLSVLFEALRFFQQVSPLDFLFGRSWSPQTAIRADQVGSSGAFGAVPLFAGTLLISGIAMLVAVPVGLMSAIYLSEYASRRLRAYAKPMLEILAGIPTVVYGYFAALTVGPILRAVGESLGLEVASESALGAGLVMGIMIIPFVSSLSDDVITAVPQALRDGSYGLGATRSETIRHVVLPSALPGIVGAVLLAVSRAIGETMIVVMAAGLAANLTANPFEAVTTVTVQIVTLLVGDQEFDSPKTLAAFALGLVLFLVTLALNVIALRVVRRYREQYE
ncbi:MAG TPA: phosphate ABC transporter permease subunit PstC [Gammaproteobacteria bacterium]|nr:phosphate ABC transporter permease subunit PstC [Gammaproteobacteria bacterium]